MKKYSDSDIPFYLKFSILLIGLVALFYVIDVAQAIIVPFLFSTIIAILINPVINYLAKKGLNRIIAISITLILSLCLLSGLIIFILSQASMLMDTLPLWKGKFNLLVTKLVSWISYTFNIGPEKIITWLNRRTSEGIGSNTAWIGNTISSIGHFVVTFFLIPVYIFLLLVYKQLLLKFISKLFSNDKHHTVIDILNETKSLTQSYLIGLLTEAVIVAVLHSLILLLIGIEYAMLFGIMCAVLNLIPYIGGLFAILIIMTFAFVTKSPISAIYVLIAQLSVQIVDNNFLVPKIVGAKVKINALVSILVVIIGGALCGIPGMFLSIPITGIFKVVCDRIESLKPLGFLLGDIMPINGKSIFDTKKTYTG